MVNYQTLNKFFVTAAQAAYAGGGTAVTPWKRGFSEYEHREGDWYYRDSFCGYFRSWGQEAVYHNDRPLWVQDYGGGMEPQYVGNATLTQKTFNFLKKALATKLGDAVFQPRGPKEFTEGEWRYETTLTGDIAKFDGTERIFYKNNLVFTHRYFGGLVLNREV